MIIQVNSDKSILVDEEDYERVRRKTWTAYNCHVITNARSMSNESLNLPHR